MFNQARLVQHPLECALPRHSVSEGLPSKDFPPLARSPVSMLILESNDLTYLVFVELFGRARRPSGSLGKSRQTIAQKSFLPFVSGFTAYSEFSAQCAEIGIFAHDTKRKL